MNTSGGSRVLLIRAYSATVGATDGNIIAAIITTQTLMNQPNVPSPVHGPLSMPRICPTVHHQPTPASAKRTTTRRQLSAGGRVRGTKTCAGAAAPTRRRSFRQAAHEKSDFDSPVFPSYSMPKALIRRPLRLGHRQIRPDRVEHPGEPHRLAGLHTERDDVLDLEVDRIADADAVPQPVVLDIDRARARRPASRRSAGRAPPSAHPAGH